MHLSPTTRMATITLSSILLILLFATSATAFNITKILAKHPGFSQFNQALTKTHLAAEINSRKTITVLALDNSAMSSLLSKGFSQYTLKKILSLHVLVDYYGTKKLHQLTDGTTTTASLYQSSGDVAGDAGYVNITDMKAGKVGFGPADTNELHASFVKSVVEMPYDISVIQISQALDSAQAEAPTPEPSTVNLTSLLSSKGCKEFSKLLSSSDAEKTFQDNIDSGLTVFCASDNGVKAFMPKYKNLTDGNKTAVLLYHGIPVYNSISMLKSSNGLMNTLATDGANKYDVTVQNDGDSVTLKTKVVTSKIMGTLVDEDPLAVYKIDKFLLPRELFKASKADVAEAPTPEAESPYAADGPDTSDDDVADQVSKKHKNNAGAINSGRFVVVGLALCYDDVADQVSKKHKNNAGAINGGRFVVVGLALCYGVLAFL